jgi:hypothetical protein
MYALQEREEAKDLIQTLLAYGANKSIRNLKLQTAEDMIANLSEPFSSTLKGTSQKLSIR